MKEIDVVILCGGQGKRLRSVIGESQKVMTDLNGDPFLTLIVNYLKDQGFHRIIFCSGYKSEDIRKCFTQSHWKALQFEFSEEREPLGTGGAIANALSLVRSNPFFVLNGDSFCPIDYAAFLKFHMDKKAEASIAVAQVIDTKDYGNITLDQNQRIQNFEEKNTKRATRFVNAGVYCFNSDIKEVFYKPSSIEKDIFPQLTKRKFYGYLVKQNFMDIGTPDRLEEAKKILKKGMK